MSNAPLCFMHVLKNSCMRSDIYGLKTLDTIDQYVIRYELQSRGSMHAHIILWINQVDIKRITNEMMVATPVIFGTTIGDFLEPIDSHQNKLFKIVMSKQLHTCNSRCQQQINDNNANIDFLSKRTLKCKQYTTLNKKM